MACPAEGWFGLFLKLATPYDVSQTHAIRYSLTECTCSVLCACCLPALGRADAFPEGRRRYEHDTSTHMYRYDASGGGITAARSRRSSAT